MSTTKADFSEYTVTLSTDQASYGCTCSDEQAAVIARKIGSMLETQFSGIVVRFSSTGDGIRGPQQDIIDWVREMVQKNYLAVI